MYKVFIDNKPNQFEVGNEKDLLACFPGYKFVEAAGGIVQSDSGFLFILRHGLWDIPKGKLDAGESPEEGAVREIEEECGLIRPEIIKHLLNTWHTYEHKGKQVLKKTYWFWLRESDQQAELIPQQEEGITEVRYFKKADFNKVKGDTYNSIREVIEALEKEI